MLFVMQVSELKVQYITIYVYDNNLIAIITMCRNISCISDMNISQIYIFAIICNLSNQI